MVEIGVVAAREGFEARPNSCLFHHGFYDAVAVETAVEWVYKLMQIEAIQNFLYLGAYFNGTDPATVGHGFAKQQTPVPGQYDAFFIDCEVDYLLIIAAVGVCGVKPQHSQAACELAEVNVDDKSGIA